MRDIFTLCSFNPFHAAAPFVYPLKTSENQRFSDVLIGCRKRIVSWNGLTNAESSDDSSKGFWVLSKNIS